MLVYYSGFWNGFHSAHDPIHDGFFNDILTKIFNTYITHTTDINSGEILIESIFTESPVIESKKWKYSILFSGESRVPSNTNLYSIVLWIKNNKPNFLALPLFIPYVICNNFEYTLVNPRPITYVPTNTVCAVISNPSGIVRTLSFTMSFLL